MHIWQQTQTMCTDTSSDQRTVSTTEGESEMNYRVLGKTGFNVSEISLGTWQLGAKWGDAFDPKVARETLETAFDSGVNFYDTADVYNDGLSEKALGPFIRDKGGKVIVATKCGRQLSPHTAQKYTCRAITDFVEDSLGRMGVESLQLVQLHCPPTDVYYNPEVFDCLDKLQKSGKIQHYGVSIERVEEGLKALEYDGVASIQVIYNVFRQRPEELLFPMAKERNVGIICRVPLASGMLTGKFSRDTVFGTNDHRFFNRKGESFDRGETFAGVPFELGLDAVEALQSKLGPDVSLASAALKWILRRAEVSCVITGASAPSQIERNTDVSTQNDLTPAQLDAIDDVYRTMIKEHVHHIW